jgi:hypothetical protein
MIFFYSFQSEWLKKKHSAAAALVWIGAFLIPLILLIVRLKQFGSLAAGNASPVLWEGLYGHGWQFMAIFLLPLGVMLATSLITQLEYRNNTWKQAHTTPQDPGILFLSKLSVIVVMLLQFFILFNFGIYLAGIIPALFSGVPYPLEPFPWRKFLEGSGFFFLDTLPIVALQYLVSMQFRNFMVPLAVGIGFYVASMVAVNWEYGYTVPYSYSSIEFVHRRATKGGPAVSIHAWALAYFAVFIILSYILYRTKRDKS